MKTLFLALVCACVVGCGGGGGSAAPEPAWSDPFAFTISEGNQNGLLLPSTDTGGYTVQELRCTLTSRGYWDTGGHLAILLRYTPPPYPGLAGAGLALGKTGVFEDSAGHVWLDVHEARPMVEVWAPGAGAQYNALQAGRDSILPPDTLGPVLADATPYPFTLRVSEISVQYTMAGYDSGVWRNPSTGADLKQTGILVTTSVHDNVPGWRAEFTECRTRWSN